MKKFEFIQDHEEHKKGEVIDMKMDIYHKYIHPLLLRGILKVIRSDEDIKKAVNQEMVKDEDDENQALIDLLNYMKMGALREFGKKYNAMDTKKSELVLEILEKAPIEKVKKFIEDEKNGRND